MKVVVVKIGNPCVRTFRVVVQLYFQLLILISYLRFLIHIRRLNCLGLFWRTELVARALIARHLDSVQHPMPPIAQARNVHSAVHRSSPATFILLLAQRRPFSGRSVDTFPDRSTKPYEKACAVLLVQAAIPEAVHICQHVPGPR